MNYEWNLETSCFLFFFFFCLFFSFVSRRSREEWVGVEWFREETNRKEWPMQPFFFFFFSPPPQRESNGDRIGNRFSRLRVRGDVTRRLRNFLKDFGYFVNYCYTGTLFLHKFLSSPGLFFFFPRKRFIFFPSYVNLGLLALWCSLNFERKESTFSARFKWAICINEDRAWKKHDKFILVDFYVTRPQCQDRGNATFKT